MDFPTLAAGLIAVGVAVLTSALLVFVTYRFNTLITRGVDEDELLRAGNRSVAIALGSVILAQAILLRHAVFPVMVVVRDLLVRPVTAGAAAWVLGHCLLFFIILGILAYGSVAVAAWLFARLTRALPEREEILKDNLAVALFFAFTVIAIALILNEGIADLARSIVPYADTGIVHLE